MTCESSSQDPGWSYAARVKCHDCGTEIACGAEGVPEDHECKSEDIRVQQASLAAWEDGYRFAIQNRTDALVQADAVEFGAGWIKFVRLGGIHVEGELS